MSGETSRQPNNVIAAVAYLGFFVTGIIFLYLEPYSHDDYVRFHARQSIGFSVLWFAVEIVFGVFIAVLPHSLGALLGVIQGLINLVFAIFWLFLIYKAYIGERYRIPELADIVDSVFNQTSAS
ncbi:MAG: DUF4870 domain-containing protein [Candidatus Binataceae bacterium]